MRVHGINSVREALKAGKVNRIYISSSAKSSRISGLVSLAKKSGIPVVHVKNLNSNVEADISPVRYLNLDLIIEKALKSAGVIVFLDSVQDPQNLGSVIRNAVFFGCTGVVIPKRRGVQVNETVIKTSSGAVFHINISRVSNLANSIKKLKKYGFLVLGAEPEGRNIGEIQFDFPLAVVIGGEDEGISKPVREQCDEIVSIPSHGKTDSLNLSCASAILLYEIRRRIK